MYFVQYILYLKSPCTINTIKYIPRDNRIPSTVNASEKSFHCNPLYLPTIIETRLQQHFNEHGRGAAPWRIEYRTRAEDHPRGRVRTRSLFADVHMLIVRSMSQCLIAHNTVRNAAFPMLAVLILFDFLIEAYIAVQKYLGTRELQK